MTARLYPDVLLQNGRYAYPANAIDGRTNIGESGRDTVLNCASTRDPWRKRPLQYLQIDLKRSYSIAAVRLHLRDGVDRRKWQNGLVVSVSNTFIMTSLNVGTICGKSYNATTFGQSPFFHCSTSGRYVNAVLLSKDAPLQVCEMEIFKGWLSVAYVFVAKLRDKYYVTLNQITFITRYQKGSNVSVNVCGWMDEWKGVWKNMYVSMYVCI